MVRAVPEHAELLLTRNARLRVPATDACRLARIPSPRMPKWHPLPRSIRTGLRMKNGLGQAQRCSSSRCIRVYQNLEECVDSIDL
jgi:hypothetical protein